MIEYLVIFKKICGRVGCGHQALMIMLVRSERQNCLRSRFRDVQAEQTPWQQNSHVFPEQLFIDPPEAILVMAGSYSDGVISEIRHKHHNRFSLAVLRGQEVDLNPGFKVAGDYGDCLENEISPLIFAQH